MLFARAMSNGVRWYCPDVFAGMAVYTPDEMGADVDGEGNVIEGVVVQTKPPLPFDDPDPVVLPDITLDEARAMRTAKGSELGTLNKEQLH